MINDMCINKNRRHRRVIRKEKNMMRKMKKKKRKKKEDKNDKFPRARDWTLTTDRNMVRSDALPTELRGTCQYVRLNFNVMF